MTTVGAMASTAVTVKVAVAVLPAASWAVTVRTFGPSWMGIPLAVQFVVPVAVPLAPRLVAQVTWVTPTLSAAGPPSVRTVLLGREGDAEGRRGLVEGWSVGACGSSAVEVEVAVAVLPAASWAVTVRTFVPSWMGIPLAVQLVVPVAVPLAPRLVAQVTWVTPTLSAAVPPSVRTVL